MEKGVRTCGRKKKMIPVRHLSGIFTSTPYNVLQVAGIYQPCTIISKQRRPGVSGAHASDLGHGFLATGLVGANGDGKMEFTIGR